MKKFLIYLSSLTILVSILSARTISQDEPLMIQIKNICHTLPAQVKMKQYGSTSFEACALKEVDSFSRLGFLLQIPEATPYVSTCKEEFHVNKNGYRAIITCVALKLYQDDKQYILQEVNKKMKKQ